MNTSKLIIVAVGGQGNISAARVLGEAALASHLPVRMSEFHGMAQRGGVVESMVLFGEGKSYCIADGDADVLLGFEPSETLRAAKKCSADTIVITNTTPVPPYTVALGKAHYPDMDQALALMAGRVKKLVAFDATSLALRAGSALALNMVMLGALAKSGAVPLSPDLLQQTIEQKTRKQQVEVNLRAFRMGLEAV
ncbi:indolepyruvate oxidoreductase subunit beta [Desulfobulbus alkaliphilus]|uniref:indolepyruvate oxidoreductase subunit beta n=1 Tax=Desulfobulbus alkaliphilus TaxID=869814 RepID=UPI0019666BDD|nr:indolepyruvate oxidoreductase subunit beta [Desulfobulbus alkaliphilus]MBM9535639.1 indolepyruvate oxidoreductase subunit beta [Desulfobulbus alkaliphilus]